MVGKKRLWRGYLLTGNDFGFELVVKHVRRQQSRAGSDPRYGTYGGTVGPT